MESHFPNDLNEVLSSPTLLAIFESYLRKINAHENLLFIEAISQLKCNQDTRMIERAVHRIWKTFINPGSPFEINITDRNDIIKQLVASKNLIITVADALKIFHKSELEIRYLLQIKLAEFIKMSNLPSVPTNMPKTTQKKVVIVGGGFVGFTVASILDPMPYFHVTLIDTKDSFEYTPGIIKMLVRPEESSSLRVRHDAYVKNGRIVIGHADKIVNDATGILVNNETINFDYLVIGTGSIYQSKLKSFDISALYRMSELKSEYLRLKQAKNVLIIGGGLVGCELASEIALHTFKGQVHEKKSVTLVESHSSLVHRSPLERQEKAYHYLKKIGVNVILNEKIVDFNSDGHNSYLGSSGHIYTDFNKVYIATGTIPNSELLKNSCNSSSSSHGNNNEEEENCNFESCLDYLDRICVKPTLQLDHSKYQHIFAGGDVTNRKEEKTGCAAVLSGSCIARNICRMEKGKKPLCQGDKGTLPAPSLPLHGVEKNGGIGRQNLPLWKKALSFLHPNWAALKFFDEKEFLQVVAGEANHSRHVMGQLPKKLVLQKTNEKNSNQHQQKEQNDLSPPPPSPHKPTYNPPSPISLSGDDILSCDVNDTYINNNNNNNSPKHTMDQHSISSESTLSTLPFTHPKTPSIQSICLNAIHHLQPNFRKDHHTELS